jgi:hypothetical protein
MEATARITGRSTMQEVLEAYPSAQRALFRRYHIGGCHSCGYQPEDTLEQVAHRHNLFDLDEVVAFILHADEIDRRIQVSPVEVATALRSSAPPRLVDVRRLRSGSHRISGATLISEELAQEMMQGRRTHRSSSIATMGSAASMPPRTSRGTDSGTSGR